MNLVCILIDFTAAAEETEKIFYFPFCSGNRGRDRRQKRWGQSKLTMAPMALKAPSRSRAGLFSTGSFEKGDVQRKMKVSF